MSHAEREGKEKKKKSEGRQTKEDQISELARPAVATFKPFDDPLLDLKIS